MTQLPEPERSAFVRLIEAGAGAVDIFGTDDEGRPSAGFVNRELQRPQEHQRNICRYIKRLAPQSILDMGCGTGGLTVALCATFPLATVVGVDAVPITIEAARVRAAGYKLNARFEVLPQDTPLPYPDGSFDLVTCTSVIEFITDGERRRMFARELVRVARSTIVLTTPNPLSRLREQHTRRLLGDFRRARQHPWASTPWELNRLFAPFTRRTVPDRVREKLRAPGLPASVARTIEWTMPWQFAVYEAPAERTRPETEAPAVFMHS